LCFGEAGLHSQLFIAACVGCHGFVSRKVASPDWTDKKKPVQLA